MKLPTVIVPGQHNGEGMVIHYQTSRGTDIFGLGMPNIYAGADFDLGPTWCYLITGQKTTLVDTGRFGDFDFFKHLMNSTDKQLRDIDRIVVSHGHEDHDGNLSALLAATGAEVWAHWLYPYMISYYPEVKDGAPAPELPLSCRFCDMNQKFRQKNCLRYHAERSVIKVDRLLQDGDTVPGEHLTFISTPGHSPDSICILLEDEAIFTGDTLLPDITPHPSQAFEFQANCRILPESYRSKNTLYGLMVYIKSLNKIAYHASQPVEASFPAHRLFYSGQFNIIDSSADRSREIIQFHIDRCRTILEVIRHEPAGIDDIAARCFTSSELKGSGKIIARNEIKAHVEVMETCYDVRWTRGNGDLVQSTGSERALSCLAAFLDQNICLHF